VCPGAAEPSAKVPRSLRVLSEDPDPLRLASKSADEERGEPADRAAPTYEKKLGVNGGYDVTIGLFRGLSDDYPLKPPHLRSRKAACTIGAPTNPVDFARSRSQVEQSS
jgi:hypothetical protein